MKISADKHVNSALAEEAQGLRSAMVGQADTVVVSGRFTVKQCVDRPAMIITDGETGNEAIVPLFAYSAVRKVLGDLF